MKILGILKKRWLNTKLFGQGKFGFDDTVYENFQKNSTSELMSECHIIFSEKKVTCEVANKFEFWKRKQKETWVFPVRIWEPQKVFWSCHPAQSVNISRSLTESCRKRESSTCLPFKFRLCFEINFPSISNAKRFSPSCVESKRYWPKIHPINICNTKNCMSKFILYNFNRTFWIQHVTIYNSDDLRFFFIIWTYRRYNGCCLHTNEDGGWRCNIRPWENSSTSIFRQSHKILTNKWFP